jgi:hypothetical protein
MCRKVSLLFKKPDSTRRGSATVRAFKVQHVWCRALLQKQLADDFFKALLAFNVMD